MIKAVDPAAVITDVRVDEKTGGKSGPGTPAGWTAVGFGFGGPECARWPSPSPTARRPGSTRTGPGRSWSTCCAGAGCDVVDGPLVIPDGEPVEEALRDSISAGYDVVVTTGGTGLTPADLTPEMTRRILDREIPGIAEAIRMAGANAGVPTAILSRGVAGLAGRTLIVNLPGSTGGVKDGMAVLSRILEHAVDQVHGGDHRRGPAAEPAAE